MLSPLWAHLVGVDMSPAARLMFRMDLDHARLLQQALMRPAGPLPGRIALSIRRGFPRAVHHRVARSDEEPVQ